MTKQKNIGILLIVSALAVGTSVGYAGEAFAEVKIDYFASGHIKQGINSDTTDAKSKVGVYSISGYDDRRSSVHVSMTFYPEFNTYYEVRLINTSNGDEFVVGELKNDDKRDFITTSEDLSTFDMIKVFEISEQRSGHSVFSGQDTIEYLDDAQAPTRLNT